MIHPTAAIDSRAFIEDDVEIGAFSVIHADVHIGHGSRIGSHCSLGGPESSMHDSDLVIGPHATIRSHAVLYAGSEFGARLETGHHVTLREGLAVGENLRVGTGSDLQGDTTIGNYVRIHSRVFVPKLCTLGDFVWLYPGVIVTNDPHPPNDEGLVGVIVEDYAVVGAGSRLMPGITIGRRSLTAAGSVVTRDVPEGTLVVGSPARPIGPTSDIQLRDGSRRPAYPWTQYFRRGYPTHVTEEWDEQFG